MCTNGSVEQVQGEEACGDGAAKLEYGNQGETNHAAPPEALIPPQVSDHHVDGHYMKK